jgi:hypothetical protein
MTEDNSHAGQGAVLLDIGGDIGALVLAMPAALEGHEIEIRPIGHDHSVGRHAEEHEHDHALPHVGVLGRPVGDRVVFSAVFGELRAGRYELYVRPSGPVQLDVEIHGGEVSYANWPA